MSYRYTLDRLVPDTTLSTKEMVMFCSGCFASLSQYEMLMCKNCRRIYCRRCTGVDMGSRLVQTQLDRCAICRKRKPHPESILFFAMCCIGRDEAFMNQVRSAAPDAGMDSVEDLLRRVCEESETSYAEWQDQYERWCKQLTLLHHGRSAQTNCGVAPRRTTETLVPRA